MLKNICNRVISVASALAMMACISLPQIHIVYASYQDNEENAIYSQNLDEPSNTQEQQNETITFNYDGQDFLLKAQINSDTTFSIDDTPLTADDVQLVASAIDETNEQYQSFQENFADSTHKLLLYNIDFYTKDGKKVNVSNCDANIKLTFKEPSISCNKEEIKVIHIDDTSLNSTDISITGTSFINNQLTDVSFHVSSFSMYGILFPDDTQSNQIETNSSDIITYENIPNLLSEENNSSSNNSGNTVHTIETFKLELDSGLSGTESVNGKNVWTPTTSNEGHGFIYKITFSISGEGTTDTNLGPKSIEIKIPKQILKDKSGNDAGEILLPYPNENEDRDSEIQYVYREDGDNIVIYNVKEVQAGTVEIPFMYETTEKTWEYTDMEEFPCQATVIVHSQDADGNLVNIPAETDEIPVCINTNVEIKSTSKAFKYIYNEWQSSWGLGKPTDADDYIYIVWQVNSSITGQVNPSITDITQKYNFNLNDTFHGLINVENAPQGEVIGYKMKEDSKYVSSSGTSRTVTDLTASSRTDYVLTRYPKNAINITDKEYELKNTVTATVTPSDGKDAVTTDTATATYTYKEPTPVEPEYTPPTENYTISKYGIYGSKKHVTNQNQISSYALDNLKNDKNISGLMYHIQANAYAYIHTLPDGVDGTIEESAINNEFGKNSVTYAVSDSQIFLNDSENTLSKEDYTFTSLEYNVKMQSATYNEETKSFIKSNVTTFADTDILTFYVMTDDNEEYIPVATYNLYTKEINITNNSYVSSLTNSKISFKGDIKGWKIETSNPYYYTSFDIYPTITLKSTENVKNSIGEDVTKISVKNNSVLQTFDSNNTLIVSRSATGTDYVAQVQRNSNISKKFVSSKNYTGQRCYKVNWETSINETYTDDNTGSKPVRQESGVFYDLLPIGSRIDISSIKVYADGVELSEGEYIIETTQDYKNSNRTLLTVRINVPAETTTGYKIAYTTVHLWEDVLDYGRYVLNSVAYETGNDDIANGYPDNGGKISDSTILEDLDPDTNAKRFIYSQATHSINALIPYSSGITKKVASSNDAIFSDSTIVHQNSDYTYNIRMENASQTSSKDIIILDSIENFCNNINGDPTNKTCDWHGTLESFGLENLISKGIEPVVYVSTEKDINLETYTASSSTDFLNNIISNTSTWTEVGDFKTYDYSNVTAFAIDLSKKTDDSKFILNPSESFSFTVNMHSPSTTEVDSNDTSPETYNNVYRSFTSIDTQTDTETYYYTHYDYTTVTYRVVGTLHFKKIASDTREPIQGVKFNLSGTSHYGTKIDKDVVTTDNGEIHITNLERGTYTLKETYSTVDYLPCEDKIVIVDANGNVTITGTTDGEQSIPIIEDEPRIHGDLKFLKKDALNLNIPAIGAEFQLTGTSDYGNPINKTAISDGYGVTFEDIELGTYKLVEISTPTSGSYIKPKINYTVVCNSDGILSIKELSINDNGDYIITNMPTQSFTINKVDKVSRDPLQYAEYTLTSTNTVYGYPITKTLTTNMYGDIEFTGLDFGTYTLQETNAPPNHILDTTVYTVEIVLDENNKTVVTIKKPDYTLIEPKTDLQENKFFEFENERSYTGTIKIIKNWVDDKTNAERTTPVIHLSTEEPKVEIHTATIDISKLKIALGTLGGDATSFQRNDTYSEEDVLKLNYIIIGEKDNTNTNPDKQEDVYLFKETQEVTAEDGTTKTEVNYYYWSKAKNIYLGELSAGSANNLFVNCRGTIEKIDLSGLNTSKVTSMFQMFNECSSLTSLNLSGFNSSKVTNMSEMFRKCSSLTSLDLSGFNTCNVETMEKMFSFCSGLTSLDLSKFNTSNVKNMSYMFYNCSKLTDLNLSNFDTSNVGSDDVINSNSKKYEGSMYQMFYGCSGLTSLDLSSFNTSNVKTMEKMFEGCTQLHTINFGQSFELNNVTTMEKMFYGCKALTNADFSTFGNAPLLKNINWMFLDCQALTTINLANFTTSDTLTYMEKVFKNCSALTTLDISKLNTINVTTMEQMFYGCSSLKSLDLSNFKTSNVTNMTNMFNLGRDNYNLKTIYVSSNLWSTESVPSGTDMFAYCFALKGGNGTVYPKSGGPSDRKKVIYARIDKEGSPGYFTDINDKPTTTSTTSASATETQVTAFFNSVSNTVRAYKAVANASLMVLPTLLYANETTTPTTTDTTPTNETETQNNNNNKTEYISTDEKFATWTKEGDTWVCEFKVYDDEAEYFVWEEPISGYKSNATDEKPLKVNADGKILKTQTITNTTKDVGNLVLSKQVTRNGELVENNSTEFKFRITLKLSTTENLASGNGIDKNFFNSAYTFGNVKFTPKYTLNNEGKLTDENGTIVDAENYLVSDIISIKNNESLTIASIPVGVNYEIEEITDGMSSCYTSVPPANKSGDIVKDTNTAVTWENKVREVGAFHVSKTVELYEVTEKLDGTTTTERISLTDEEKNQYFTFSATLSNLDTNTIYSINKNDTTLKTFTSDTSGNATVEFTLKHEEKADFIGIPIGAMYQITESNVDGYQTSYQLTDANNGTSIVSSTGTSSTATETLDNNEDITVAFTNTKTITITETVKNIEVSVEKIWLEDNENIDDRPKSITVYLNRGAKLSSNSDNLVNPETCNTATITADDEWKIVFKDLPEKDEQGREYVYSVKEEPIAGYNSAITSHNKDANGNYSFTITNTKQPTYDLSINKTVDGVLGNKAKQFEFTITLKDNTNKPLNGFYTLQRGDTENLTLFDVNGTAKVGISHGETVVIKNLPQGTNFTITETDYSTDGYTTQSGLFNDTLTANPTVIGTLNNDTTVKYVNTRDGIVPTGIDSNAIPLIILGILSASAIILLKKKISH